MIYFQGSQVHLYNDCLNLRCCMYGGEDDASGSADEGAD